MAMVDECCDGLDDLTLQKLQAGAFTSLCQHLQGLSPTVSNMELMTLSGFCRNCLAKWMVLEARKLSSSEGLSDERISSQEVEVLHNFGYEQAAQRVYGMQYGEWKKRYQSKATEDEMKRYKASQTIHAVHDMERLATKSSQSISHNSGVDREGVEAGTIPTPAKPIIAPNASNVCCQDVELVQTAPKVAKNTREIAKFQPPPLPDDSLYRNGTFPTIAILTVSDRAFHGEYASGDLSGPATAQAIELCTHRTHEFTTAIVPDDSAAIQAKLQLYAGMGVDLILTTGGTGFGPRDVTPEATRDIVDHELPSLMALVVTESSATQPLASLSRGTAGILKHTVVCNLPGNPRGVREILPMLLPLLLHAVADSHHGTPEVLHIG